MARPRSATGSIDDLGYLLTAAYGLDRTWTEKAKCKDHPKRDPLHPSPWQFNPDQRLAFTDAAGVKVVVRGREMVEVALIICHSCPVQYECAAYAVQGQMNAGTWGMRIFDLQWLQRQADWRSIIAAAKWRHKPIQRHVHEVRAREALYAGTASA